MFAHTLFSNIITVALCVPQQCCDVFLVAVGTYFLVSWELHLLDSAFIMFAGQAAVLSLAGKSKVFFKCLKSWLPSSLEVKIKTRAWGLRAQNAIYSSSLISSGIPVGGWWFWKRMHIWPKATAKWWYVILRLPVVWKHSNRSSVVDENHDLKGLNCILGISKKALKLP